MKRKMNKKMNKKMGAIALSVLLSLSVAGCSAQEESSSETQTTITNVASTMNESSATNGTSTTNGSSSGLSTEAIADAASTSILSSTEGSALDTSELFSERDLEQSADLSGATYISLESEKDITIDTEGVYVLSGKVENVTVTVEAAEDAKVQIVLDGVSITNVNSPAIYVKAADKVFITTTDSENNMQVTGSFVADGDTNLDAVIYSKADLTLNGTGSLSIISNEGNGITSKDDLKVTGGVYTIQTAVDGMEANDGILIYDGEFTINSGKDAILSENEEDDSQGFIYIHNGSFQITAADDAIQGNSIVQIDGGIINIESCTEGIEGTYIQINEGELTLYATDDGINATSKSSYDVKLEVNGGTINVTMGSGDTDAFDANGDLIINGGTITVEAQSAFDSDGTAELNGGDVTVNGEIITQITQSQMGGGRGKGNH